MPMVIPEGLEYRPDYAVTPGETLREVLADRRMTQAELARRMSRPAKTINEILKGKAALTAETALQLEVVLGVPAGFWLNREARYREALARHARYHELTAEAERVAGFPYAALVKLGFVPAARRPEDKVAGLRAFFGVDSLASLDGLYAPTPCVARRRQPSPGALMAWLRIGELCGQKLEVAAFSAARLRARVGDLRSLTRLGLSGASERLAEVMAECGVRLVSVPHLPRTYADGATRWTRGTPLIQLTVRGDYEDSFWFALFHEIGHILCGHSRQAILIAWQDQHDRDETEREADQYASDTLIPPRDYGRLSRHRPLSEADVHAFAAQVGVCPAIVVGRLQHDELLAPTHLGHLRRKLSIVTAAG